MPGMASPFSTGNANKPINYSPLPPGNWQPFGDNGLVQFNPATNQWATFVGRGNYDISDTQPTNVPGIVPNQGTMGQLNEAWSNGFGMAVTLPFGGAAAAEAFTPAAGMSLADANTLGTMTEGGGVTAGAGATAAVEGGGGVAASAGGDAPPPFALNSVDDLSAWNAFPGPSSGSAFDFPFQSNAGLSANAFDVSNLGPSVESADGASGGWGDYWKQAKPWLRGASGALSIGGGIMNMINSRKMANAAQGMQDPHQGQYRDQLAFLQAHPESVKDMPGYQFGMDEGRLAIQRQGAASGSGGNEAIALARYTPQYAQNFYQQQFQNLASLSQGNPGAALTGQALANQMANQSLWQLGWGANTFLGKD